MYRSTKCYGHDLGLSACFRQHKAESHCNLLHGYALAFMFTFEAQELDARNWVVDFGGLAVLKDRLKETFDHKLLVAEDDPQLDFISSLAGMGLAEVLVVPRVGCESFAEMGARIAHDVLCFYKMEERVRVISCEVREHGANGAIFLPPLGHYDAPPPSRRFMGMGEGA